MSLPEVYLRKNEDKRLRKGHLWVFSNEIDYYYGQKDYNLDQQMTHFSTRIDGNKLAKYGSSTIFLPMILIAPLPTLVTTNQLNAQMIHGTIFVKNIMAFFVILALVL